jgi:hypothetical protein
MPSRFTRFIVAKYGGGAGWPERISLTNPSASAIANLSAPLNRRSYPSVLVGTAPIALPQALPAPWAGRSCR